MSEWTRRIRGAVGMGAAWAAGWGLVGALTGMITGLLPAGHPMQSALDPWLALAMPGFVGGVVFSAVLRIAEGRRSFDELSLPRFAAWGALAGLALGAIPLALATPIAGSAGWLPTLVTVGSVTLLSAASASGTLALARTGEEREQLEAG